MAGGAGRRNGCRRHAFRAPRPFHGEPAQGRGHEHAFRSTTFSRQSATMARMSPSDVVVPLVDVASSDAKPMTPPPPPSLARAPHDAAVASASAVAAEPASASENFY